MGLGNLKDKASGKTPAKKKSGMPVVKASDVVEQAIIDFRSAKEKEKQAKAEIADAEERMLDEADELRVRQSRANGENIASIRLEAGKQSIQFTQKKQFKKMTDENEDAVRTVVGAANFDKWFKTRTTYSFNGEALAALPNADKIADAIVAALGEHVDLLHVETELVPTDSYADATTLDPKAEKMGEKLVGLGLAIPYKGSFR